MQRRGSAPLVLLICVFPHTAQSDCVIIADTIAVRFVHMYMFHSEAEKPGPRTRTQSTMAPTVWFFCLVQQALKLMRTAAMPRTEQHQAHLIGYVVESCGTAAMA